MPDSYNEHLHSGDDAGRVALARSVAGIPITQRRVPYRNIGALLAEQADRYEAKTWMVFYPDDGPRVEYSYREFFELVRRTAHLMSARGIGRGDRVCTVSHNHAETVVHYFAAWMLGAAVVPVNLGEDDRRIAYIMGNSLARLAFVRGDALERIERLHGEFPDLAHIVECGDRPSNRHPWYRDALAAADPAFLPSEEADLADESLIVYTSGTTGLPKGVVLDQYNLLVDAAAIAEWHGMEASQRMMCVLPIHHVNGTVVTLVTPVYFGGSVVLNQKFHSHHFFGRAAVERVSVASVVPTLLQFLLHDGAGREGHDLSAFRHMICGAGPLTCELAERFEEKFGIPIVHGYGLSETTCYSCFLPIDLPPAEHRYWMREHGFPSIGVAIPPNEMDIHTPDGEPVPDGERGEIVIRGHNVMKHYYRNPDANAHTFAHGWFRSGDEGFYRTDARGRKFFFITGRIKELIIRGGVNIAPLEIDEVINACPGVRSGIAVGFENDWYGEEVGALVVRADEELTEEDVLTYCRKSLPASKCPKVVLFSDAIPVTSTGKYQRNKVKHLFEEWKGRQFH